MAFNDYFEPVIGSGFDSLAAQRFGWAQLNNQTQRGNIDSAIRAQEEANAFAQSLASQRQQALDRDAQLAIAAKQFDVQQRQAQADRARADFEWTVNEHRLTAAQKERERQDTARNDFLHQQTADAKKENQDNLDQIAGVAKFLAPQFNDQGEKVDEAKAEFDNSQTNLLSTINDYQKKLAPHKVVWNPKTFTFVSGTKFGIPADAMDLVAEANDAVSTKQTAMQSASDMYNTLQNNFQNLHATAAKYNLVPGKVSGKWTLFSKLHNKAFGEEETKSSPAADFGLSATKPEDPDNPGMVAPVTSTGTNDFLGTGTGAASGTATTTNAPMITLDQAVEVANANNNYRLRRHKAQVQMNEALKDMASKSYPPAPIDKTQREINKVYQTPKGAMRWVGNGWQPL